MKRIGFTSGSFDPVTNGHTGRHRARRAHGRHAGHRHRRASRQDAAVLDRGEDRDARRPRPPAIAKKSGARIEIITFDNLTVDAAKAAGATLIFRGLRDGTDFDYEMQMAGMNGAMAPGIDTVFLPASPGVRHITGTLVRQIAMMGGDVSEFVSPGVARRLKAKAAKKQAMTRKP